jgi:hypothetical protein
MRNGLIALGMLLCSITPAAAQVSFGIGAPGVSIGINLLAYPELVPVPGYPVYYAPQMNSNYFFYDGMYWVYQRDNWYASSWYNGPWGLVAPDAVPLYILRIPVRYYRQAPVYFRGWASNAPPRWGEYWGNTWAQRRQGWDTWNRSVVALPAPLPAYQRQYSGNRYPRVAESTKRARAVSAGEAGNAPGKKFSAAGPTRYQPPIFAPSRRSTCPARTSAASGGRRCS